MSPSCGRKTTMTSSRKPETVPSRCPLCSAETTLEFPESSGDRACSACGVRLRRATVLLAQLQTLAHQHPGLELTEITAESPWPLGGDSLTAVEVMLALERELGVSISAHDVERIYTVGEAIRYFDRRLR
jgi:acyl carrier protein